MSIEKKYEKQKKRLDRAKERILELESELEVKNEKADRVDELIIDLEKIQEEFFTLVNELKDKKVEYQILISQLRLLRKRLK